MLYQTETSDRNSVLAAMDGFAEGLGLTKLSVDLAAIDSILLGMRLDFPAQGGQVAASPFKKAANFLCYFVAERPVKNSFPSELIGELARVTNHQNAMVGFHIAVDALHNAKISRKDGDVILSNRIQMSQHSYVDTIQSLSNIAPSSHFHLVSVFLEQMCYRFNPDASYPLEF